MATALQATPVDLCLAVDEMLVSPDSLGCWLGPGDVMNLARYIPTDPTEVATTTGNWKGRRYLGSYVAIDTGVRFFVKQHSDREVAAYRRALLHPEASRHVASVVVLGCIASTTQDFFVGMKAILVQDVGTTYLNADHVRDANCTSRVVEAVSALNRANIFILDLKPQHIIIPGDSNSPVKIIDFDLAETVNCSSGTINLFLGLDMQPPFRGNAVWASLFQHLGLLQDPACDLQSLCFIFHSLLNPNDLKCPTPPLQLDDNLFSTVERLFYLMRKLQLLQQSSCPFWLEKAKKLCVARVEGKTSEDLYQIMVPVTTHSPPTPTPVATEQRSSQDRGDQQYCSPVQIEKIYKSPGSSTSSTTSSKSTMRSSHHNFTESLYVEVATRERLTSIFNIDLQSDYVGQYQVDCCGQIETSDKAEHCLSICKSANMCMFLPNNQDCQALLRATTPDPELLLPEHFMCEIAYVPAEFTDNESNRKLKEKLSHLQKHMLEALSIVDGSFPLCLAFGKGKRAASKYCCGLVISTPRADVIQRAWRIYAEWNPGWLTVMASLGRFFFSVDNSLVDWPQIKAFRGVLGVHKDFPKELNKRVDGIRLENRQLHLGLHKCTENLKKCQASLELASQEKQYSAGTVLTLGRALSSAQRDLLNTRSLQEIVASRDATIASRDTTITRKMDEINKLTNQIQELQASLFQRGEQCQQLKEAVVSRDTTNAHQMEEITKLTEQIQELHAFLSQRGEQCQQLKETVASRDTTIMQQTEELNNMRASHKTTTTDLTDQIQELKSILEKRPIKPLHHKRHDHNNFKVAPTCRHGCDSPETVKHILNRCQHNSELRQELKLKTLNIIPNSPDSAKSAAKTIDRVFSMNATVINYVLPDLIRDIAMVTRYLAGQNRELRHFFCIYPNTAMQAAPFHQTRLTVSPTSTPDDEKAAQVPPATALARSALPRCT
ncbi:hypothetical protein Pelo_10484 [Pelomyxa schiedti]|nr:hypothetical protein Pelo_10484 [Pelomyxa schiedti]